MNLSEYENSWISWLQEMMGNYADDNWKAIVVGILGILSLAIFTLLLDFIIKRSLLFLTRKLIFITKSSWDNYFYENRVFNSLFHLFPLAVGRIVAPYFLYPNPFVLSQIEKVFNILFVLVFLQLFIRVSNAILSISTDENNYRTIAVRTFGQLMKVITIFFAILIIISILFDVKLTTILAGLGAATAVLLLIFRDTILGFVSGVQIASTKMIKVGDWISVPKYRLDGVVIEINLVSCKIENFDKTVSSIPTYDLITSEVKNYEIMKGTNTRRIKRSIVFNVKSFKFCDKEMLNQLKEIDLIKDYIKQKEVDFAKINSASHQQNIINGKQLSNVGIFRQYAISYLKSLEGTISQTDTLMVRQLNITPQGMPMEIYCFTNTAVWSDYERIQSDVFDHLVTASKTFDLEVVQTLPS